MTPLSATFGRYERARHKVFKYVTCLINVCALLSGIDFLMTSNIPHIFFNVLLTVHLSIFISVFNQLDAQNLFYNKFYFMLVFMLVFISCLHMFRAHVLIIRRSELHYTASGIITPIGVMIPEAILTY